MSKDTLEVLLGSRLKVKILKFLFRNSGASFSVKELARHVQDKPPTVRREIKRLIEIGLVKGSKK